MRVQGLAWVLVLGLGACVEEVEREEMRAGDLASPLRVQKVPAPLAAAHCDVNVEGQGVIDMEADYLPHVITCENGGANLEALKAQAIAARSVAYYAVETEGSICDSQGCQVYSCGNEPTDLAYQAVMETSGLYLMYDSTLTYGFYVAGDSNTAPPACVGVSGATENYVTYNEGRSGTDVIQTDLGYVGPPGFGQNRGCMGQWGARCLENDNGYDYLGILRFYYGDDIEVVQALGDCVTPVDPTEAGSSGESGVAETGSAEAGSTTTDPGTAGEVEGDPAEAEGPGASDPSAESGSNGEEESGGTAGGGSTPGGALPENYGTGGDDGCGCRSGGSQPFALGFFVLGIFGRGRVRARARARARFSGVR